MNQAGFEALRIAIVRQAADDYRQALREEKLGILKHRKDCRSDALREFFLSRYGDTLCYGNGAAILARIEKEIQEEDDE